MPATHDVVNQPPPNVGHDAYADDVALREAVAREHGVDDALHAVGRLVGDAAWRDRGRDANEHPPQLHTHDRYGRRIDEVRYHPAYHELMSAAVAHGLHAAVWTEATPGGHVSRAARYVLWPQVDSGTLCPATMTYASIPTLRQQPDLAATWEPPATSSTYDPTPAPLASKRGALLGMAMTEKQGGSDVRANRTTAAPAGAGGPGAPYHLTGHKWFCSAPMSDAFLTLAKVGDLDQLPSCFLVPRWLPDGTRNAVRLLRLKDKLGDRSNASSEVELDGTVGWLVGEEGRGIAVIMQMVAHTRLDCVMGAAGWLRHGLVEAAWHVSHREAFGRRLVEHPLMRNVVADLAIESEAATALGIRLAGAFDRAADPHEAALARILTPAAKYWVCKRAPAHAAEALECLGGNGYVEESGMPRLYRQAPLNGIWEGSGNVQCLDVLRAMTRMPESIDALRVEFAAAAGADRRLDAAVADLERRLADPAEADARRITERLAMTFQGALLVRHGAPAVADAFCASRLDGDAGLAFGTLPPSTATAAILARVSPRLG